MNNERPLILISNDDGYKARGINFVAELLSTFADVIVMAPEGGRSGMGCAITSKEPVYYSLVSEREHLSVYKCSGTPVDCVKMALHELFPDRQPDLIVGGINHGDNCAVNAHYSGTMSIALEGCIKQVPSIAFSSGKSAKDADFSYMEKEVEKLIKMALEEGFPLGVCLNVNVPDIEKTKGMKICKMGLGEWHEEWQERDHPWGGKYYWIAGYYAPYDINDEESDTWAYENGYVAVTPLQLDMTAYSFLKQFEKNIQ